jgi:chromosomal replication initiator protein
VIDNIWQEFLKIIREEVGSRVVDTWFKAVVLKRWDAFKKEVYLEAPNAFVRDWIENNYLQLCQVHLGRLLNIENPKVHVVDIRITPSHEIVDTNILAADAVPEGVPSAAASYSPVRVAPIKNNGYVYACNGYTFDNFVVGPSNSLAYAAAHAVTEKPGTIYNPLFIYGNSGLGKTHLLHAIGSGIKSRDKQAIVVYQTADRFVSEFINAIRFNKMNKFESKYQNADLLLIDDIQFISNKEQTQEAFFHIFNVLYEAHKQIVFSSDTFPQRMDGIAERLRSRLAWGLVTDIYMPSLETKVAILKRKAEMSNEVIPDDIAYFIASTAVSNIRELEGALVRVLAFASLTQQQLTLELARKVLIRAVPPAERRIVDFERVLKGINKYYSYDAQTLQSKSRGKDIAFVRHVAIVLMKRLTDKSLRDIGVFLGGRDHSTIIHAIEKIEQHAIKNPEFSMHLKKMEEDILSY